MSAPDTASTDLVVRIEPMRRRHLRAVHRIDKQVYPRPWSMALYHQELGQGPNRIYRIARVHGTIVGYAGLMIVDTDGHLTSVATDPAWQGRGVAARLLLSVFRAGIVVGCTALTLEVRVSNRRAHDLYRRFGFAPAGVRRNYYSAEGEDALIMWAHDTDSVDYRIRLREIEAELAGGTEWED